MNGCGWYSAGAATWVTLPDVAETEVAVMEWALKGAALKEAASKEVALKEAALKEVVLSSRHTTGANGMMATANVVERMAPSVDSHSDLR